jgi:hypothetical protein
MSPTCSNAAMRALISIMLAASVANGAALPHEVLDARDPAAMENAQTAQLAAAAIQQAASDIQNDPDNYFTDMSQELNKKSGWEIFRDFFFRLFAPRPEDNDSDASQTAAAVTIYVTPTPSEGGPASSALEIVIPPGPSATPSVGVVSLIPSVTQAPISEILMSILPVGDLSTAINATFLTPIFVTAPESDSAPVATETAAPFPILNATDAVASILPTAASITGEFPTIPLVTGAPYYPAPANSTLIEGTGIALPLETAVPVVNVTLPLTNVTEPLAEPLASNGTSNVTVVVVTETVTPVPIGTGIAVSAGTGLPIIIIGGSPLWPNASYGEPTTAVLPLGTGTGVPVILGTGDATAVLPIATILPAPANSTIFNSTEPVEAANASSIALPYGTGYGTGMPLATGTGGLPDSTDLPLAATPLYPNTTSTTVVPIPILVTGVPEPILINVTLPAPNVTSAALPLEGTVTEVPIMVTGAPGSVVAINVTIPGPYSNETVEQTAVAPVAMTTEAPVSVGTGVPLPSIMDSSAPFANSTVVVAAPSETPKVDAGQLNITISLGPGSYGG